MESLCILGSVQSSSALIVDGMNLDSIGSRRRLRRPVVFEDADGTRGPTRNGNPRRSDISPVDECNIRRFETVEVIQMPTIIAPIAKDL